MLLHLLTKICVALLNSTAGMYRGKEKPTIKLGIPIPKLMFCYVLLQVASATAPSMGNRREQAGSRARPRHWSTSLSRLWHRPGPSSQRKLCTHPLGRKIIPMLLLLNAENFLPGAVRKLLRGAAGLSPQLGPVPRPFGWGQGAGCRRGTGCTPLPSTRDTRKSVFLLYRAARGSALPSKQAER